MGHYATVLCRDPEVILEIWNEIKRFNSCWLWISVHGSLAGEFNSQIIFRNVASRIKWLL